VELPVVLKYTYNKIVYVIIQMTVETIPMNKFLHAMLTLAAHLNLVYALSHNYKMIILIGQEKLEAHQQLKLDQHVTTH
jgi:hypothetical protein